eukprot:CAMPEP_0113599678 /NCGR_PEP_ID=MMETSP0015_2-20120614/42281_1 /TAXON_ID=2838 /ORGANISM="Odontella" /LENGTH=1029 /DNA_ID=CAMNT_0000507843 /DNA_START=376 /DNA_END=3466 /DNA_ORIENTATION=+ /assembly_acc=CAM_ASM_000160
MGPSYESPSINGTTNKVLSHAADYVFRPISSVSMQASFSFQSDIEGSPMPWNATAFKGTLQDFGFNDTDDFTAYLTPASDVDVDGVVTALFLNAILFVMMVAAYEVLRRLVPSVYSGRMMHYNFFNLPDAADFVVPLDWVGPVFGVPWRRVRQAGGLDAYFFLRFIRLCLRITSVTAFWGLAILFPVYAYGDGLYKDNWHSWYHYSMANIDQGSWQIWVPSVFIYLFSFFVFFVMKQEYRHYVELRMQFLGRGDSRIDCPQRFSLMIEKVPKDLRSDRSLYEYFDKLFPGKIHSACVTVKLPDLEKLSARKHRAMRRLEKSVASYKASGFRPSHVVGKFRLRCLGIENMPCDPCRSGDIYEIEDDMPPPKGVRVDSITYYTQELANFSREVFLMQKKKSRIIETGNASPRDSSWIQSAIDAAKGTADEIIEESLEANELTIGASQSMQNHESNYLSRRYGSFDEGDPRRSRRRNPDLTDSTRDTRLLDDEHLVEQNGTRIDNHDAYVEAADCLNEEQRKYRRTVGRLGLDFAMAGFKYVSKHLNVVVDSVVGTTMSSTSFVTFLDHTSMTNASRSILTDKPNCLAICVAPEPRDIIWENVHQEANVIERRERICNVLFVLGAILWSIPLAAIQAFAKAEQLALIPGMEWKAFINGYLPVVALLGLILVLPVIFERVALKVEKRKTMSEVQRSMVGRYFYYQVVNIYITVTAGSVWKSLADVLEHPAEVLEILGESIPMMVGYFMAFLVTKILAGLPTIILRVGPLSRMIFLRSCFRHSKLSQRELDEVYRAETIQYGWEYPTQLLVIMIVFAYACISPVILPVGAVYFFGALMVYKKQVLYVYTPKYESGGKLFPMACDRALFGLICGQLTFIGYSLIRQGHWQPIFLAPLPFITVYMMGYFKENYTEPSQQLSLERAVDLDYHSDQMASPEGSVTLGAGAQNIGMAFHRYAYRQPVLAEGVGMPMPYRRGEEDDLTEKLIRDLRRSENRYQGMSSPRGDRNGSRSLQAPPSEEESAGTAELSHPHEIV